MDTRWGRVLGMLAVSAVICGRVGGSTAEGQGSSQEALREQQILQAIDAARQSRPALPAPAAQPPRAQPAPSDVSDVTFEQIEADPRMQRLREQFESGQLSAVEAKDRIVEILRAYDRESSASSDRDQEE